MEMRECQRRQMDGEVLLQGSGLAAHACRLQNLTLEGAYVTGGSAAGLARGAVVTIAISQSGSDGTRRYTLPARVVRTAPDGVGLRFGIMDLGAYGALLSLLFPIANDADKESSVSAVSGE